ncbi:MAG: ROK family protein [Planctomycetota bacterium]
MSSVRIGIDLGGTKIEAAAVRGESEVLWRERVATPQCDYEGTVRAVVGLVARLASDCRLAADAPVGIGAPGSASPITGLQRNSNSTCLNGMPFALDLEVALARRVRMANDANCFALAEAIAGAGAGAGVVFGVILGTGVGGGVVINRVARDGRNAVGGEFGHGQQQGLGIEALIAGRPHEPRQCYCGQIDCREQYIAGPAVEREFRARTGRQLSLADIEAAALAGDSHASAVIVRWAERVAVSLGDVVNLLDPDCIVLGGGASNLRAATDIVPARVAHYTFGDSFTTPILRAQLGDSAGVVGAAWLW